MKKLFLIFVLCLCPLPLSSKSVAYAESGTAAYFVTANSAVVFESPDLSSQKIATLTHKSEVMVETEDSAPKVFSFGEFEFYKILAGDVEGFALCDLLVPKTQTLTSTPNFNGRINTNCFVFSKEDDSFTQTEISLQKNQEIFLYEGYNTKNEFTAIAFLHENEIVYGYIKTKDIAPNGINPLIVTCICLIGAVLGIFFAWIFVKGRKKKKMA